MGDVLSQSEVESLLSALDPENQFSAPSVSRGSGGIDQNSQINVYDFKRPERVSKEQMRAFQGLHDGFSREFGAALSGMLRTIVEVKLVSVDQLTYSEFIFSLENPTCFNLLRSEGLDGHMILDLNPMIIFPIMDRLMGGGRNSKIDIPSRPLTEIELQLVSRITQIGMTGLENAWANIVPLELSVAQVESNPQLVQIVPPNEVIVLISFEITMGEVRGIMNVCVPFNTIEPLAGKLTSDSWSAYSKKVVDPRQRLNLETALGRAEVEIVAELARTTITMADVVGLEVGDVITTDCLVGHGAVVKIEGHATFRGGPGAFRGHKAFQIKERLADPEDIIEAKLKEIEEADIEPAEPPGNVVL